MYSVYPCMRYGLDTEACRANEKSAKCILRTLFISSFKHILCFNTVHIDDTCESRERGTGVRTPPHGYRIHYQFWSETFEKSKHSMLVHHWPASITPFKWRFPDGPMMAHFKRYLGSFFPQQLIKLPELDPL